MDGHLNNLVTPKNKCAGRNITKRNNVRGGKFSQGTKFINFVTSLSSSFLNIYSFEVGNKVCWY